MSQQLRNVSSDSVVTNTDQITNGLTRRKEFEAMDQLAKKSVSKASVFNRAFEEGYNIAAEDYAFGKASLREFPVERVCERKNQRLIGAGLLSRGAAPDAYDFSDMFQLGFEMGYVRKLAEIAIY
jgi:hypothetical protein